RLSGVTHSLTETCSGNAWELRPVFCQIDNSGLCTARSFRERRLRCTVHRCHFLGRKRGQLWAICRGSPHLLAKTPSGSRDRGAHFIEPVQHGCENFAERLCCIRKALAYRRPELRRLVSIIVERRTHADPWHGGVVDTEGRFGRRGFIESFGVLRQNQ